MSGWYALAFKDKPSWRRINAYQLRMVPMSAAAAEIVEAAVQVLNREREMPNDTAALRRISGHESAFASEMGKTREEIRPAFVAAVVDCATREYIHKAREDEDVLLMMEIA